MALSVSVNSGRIKYLDMTAGVLILFMLGMHFGIIDAGPSSVMNLFSIYMAWFFFKSGMFHREQQDSRYFAKKLAKKLLIPFLIFTLLGFILELSYKPMSIESVRGLAAQLITMGFAWCNAPLWFIFALFLTRMVTAKFNGRYWALWVIFFILAAFFHHQLFTERFQYIGNRLLTDYSSG